MVENRRSSGPPLDPEPDEDFDGVEGSRGSGLIFVLIAIALILAITFFYLTKDRESDQSRAVTQAVESADSAARVVGNAAQNAADRLKDRN
ncbi:MAG TPA: hypothetical protein VF489_10005 [Sphingobium sp.]